MTNQHLTEAEYREIDRARIASLKEGRVYRGTYQGLLELTLLTELKRNADQPAYYGYKSFSAVQDGFPSPFMTFCTPRLEEAVRFARERYDKRDARYEFGTSWPVVMEIDTKGVPALYKTTTGEGLILAGPIDLSRIRILYAFGIDTLACPQNHNHPNGHCGIGILKSKEFGRDDLCAADLCARLEKGEERALKEVTLNYLGTRQLTTPVETSTFIDQYTQLLRGLFRENWGKSRARRGNL